MITKTEVLKAIAECEHATGRGPLDQSFATGIQKGALAVLIEAAKCARYQCIDGDVSFPQSNSSAVLDYQRSVFRDEGVEADDE